MHPQDEIALQELAMEAIDNACRGILGEDNVASSSSSKSDQVNLWVFGPVTRNKKK